MKVNFLVIGAAKSATTSLCHGISLHPDISFSEPKEPQFFSTTDWRNHLESYHSNFKNNNNGIYGEGSTNYTKYPLYNKKIHSDIYEYNPNMKLIYIMRHPIERIISHYSHAINRGYEIEDINIVLRQNDHFLNLSKYYFQLKPYLDLFGNSQIKLLLFDEFKADPQKVLNDVYSFLGTKRYTIHNSELHKNESSIKKVTHYKYDNPTSLFEKIKKLIILLDRNYLRTKRYKKTPVLSNETKFYLINELREDIQQIEKLTGKDLSDWLI